MVVAIWLASLSGPKSTKKTRPPKSGERRCPTVTATAVLPMPPGAMERQSVRDLLDDLLPPDHLRERRGKGARRQDVDGWLRGGRDRLGERGDEAIAAPGHVDDVAGGFAGIAQHLAQRRDVEAQAALVDIDVGPDALDQLSLVDDFAGTLGEENQDIEGAAADMERHALLLQEP